MATAKGLKNEQAKSRSLQAIEAGKAVPYEVWALGDWSWMVLKQYQAPDKAAKNEYARAFTACATPMTYGQWELGDAYWSPKYGPTNGGTLHGMGAFCIWRDPSLTPTEFDPRVRGDDGRLRELGLAHLIQVRDAARATEDDDETPSDDKEEFDRAMSGFLLRARAAEHRRLGY